MQRSARNRILLAVAWNLLAWSCAACLSHDAVLAAQAPTTAENHAQNEIEKGRQAVGQACVACHTNILKMVQIHKESPEQWRDTVYSMIGRGAQIKPDEIEPVIAFLAADTGVNRETAVQPSSATRSGPGRRDQQATEADGRAVLQRSCQQCHDLATASAKLESENWNEVISRMVTYGAKLTPAERQKLIGYLIGTTK